jgi:predicted unusual protein kinase regulating ubiquinone biosynthesis (AarF/ABC1/UbiB family)
MEVRALVDLANKTMSRFPFRLPKNLALYMRMSSILEGIYYHHKVTFQFVKVLAGLLEEEGLLRDAYIEEVKISAMRFAKGIQDSVSVAPLLKTYLETKGANGDYEKNNNSALAASILGSALFIGSALMLPYNFYLAYGGFAATAVVVAVAFKKKI